MLVKKIIAIVVLLQIMAFATGVNAEGIGESIKDGLDGVNRTIFGGIFSDNSQDKDKDAPQKNKQIAKPATVKSDQAQIVGNSADSRNATIIKPSESNRPKIVNESSTRPVRVYRYDSIPASSGAPVVDNRPGRKYFEETQDQNNSDTPENTQSTAPVRRPQIVTPSKTAGISGPPADQITVASKPLHERLSQFRRSAFDETGNNAPSTKDLAAPAANNSTIPNARSSIISDSRSMVGDSAAAIEGSSASKRPQTSIVDPLSNRAEMPESTANKPIAVNSNARPTPAKRPASLGVSEEHPVVAERTAPMARMDDTHKSETRSAPKTNPTRNNGKLSANIATPTTKDEGVLFARKGPALSVETVGPRKISVGKESTYEVKIINSGDVAAEDLVVFVNLPEWADVVGMEAGIGTTQAAPPATASAPLLWKAGHLEANSQEKLVLRIIPRQSRPFDLAVRWDYKPMASQTMIEVQEPKLEMQLEGPREVNYGKKETYRLKILNSGTGSAEGVSIKFVPVGAGENVSATYDLGLLAAGEDKQIDVELTARQSGMLEIQVEAKGDTGVHAELAEKVLVRRAGLEIAADGPKLQFVGTSAAYVVRVRNTGNAPAKNVHFTATLPAGLKYLGGIEGAKAENTGNKLHWTAESINPEALQTFTLKCTPNTPGLSRIEIAASADDDLSASTVAMTQVESVANLAIDVKDPEGPVPVGEEAVYEVRIRNRGTRDAEGIEVIGYFSRGIEPVSAEGLANRLGAGQVVFTPIPTLAAGAELILKIHARAETPGNHVFRAEMHCKVLGSRLVAEDATLYYQDALAIPQNLQARPPQDRSTIR